MAAKKEAWSGITRTGTGNNTQGLHCQIYNWAYLLFTILGSILLAFGIVFKVFKLTLPALGLVAVPLLALITYFELDAWVVAFYRRYIR